MSEYNIQIRSANVSDLANIINLDSLITLVEKGEYWRDMFERFVEREGRYFLIAEKQIGTGSKDVEYKTEFMGFIVGEIRAWEFGSQPCGWILTILVGSEFQGHGVGEQLFDAVCRRMRNADVPTIRTMIAREDNLNMSFFRSQGMMAGPFIELEKPLE